MEEKRCKHCGRMLGAKNKSGICSSVKCKRRNRAEKNCSKDMTKFLERLKRCKDLGVL